MKCRFRLFLACGFFSWNVFADTPFLIVCTKDEISWDKPANAVMSWKETGYSADMACDDTEGWQAIRIKFRGASSKNFAKKQYGLEIVDAKGEKAKIGFGSMPEASDWTLRSPYIDRSFMRDALAYNLGRDMGRQVGDNYAAPRTELVELAVNGDYKGIFTLSERIERGENHVPTEKIDIKNPQNLSYIAEISARDYNFKSKHGTMINFIDPNLKTFEKIAKDNPFAAEQIQASIEFDINHFEEVLLSKNFADPETGYRSLIDFDSFVHFFIVQELSKNIDGFRRSEFFYKGKDCKFHMGPLWDFDIAFGNLNFYGMAKPKGWAHAKRWVIFPNAFWFKRLLQDPYFVEGVRKRYFELRQEGNLLDWKSLNERIDTMQVQLGDAPERDRARWKGTYKFYQKYMMGTKKRADDFNGNVQILKDWMQERLIWLDHKLL